MSTHASSEARVLSPIERWVPIAVLLYTAFTLVISLVFHPTPLYYVETDLVGEYIPAAKAIAQGRLAAEHYGYKGPGYPLLLAAATPLCGGDHYLAARLLSVTVMGAATWFAFLVVRCFAGGAVALLMLAGLFANPTFLRYAIEAGTDAPALALALLSTYGVLRTPARGWLIGAGLAAGFATVTRYNAVFLLPAAVLVLRQPRIRNLAWYAAGVLLPLGGWLLINARLTGHPLRNDNYISIAYELYGGDLALDRFGAEIGWRFHSLKDVLLFDPARACWSIVWNVGAHFVSDLHQLVPLWLGLLAGPGLILGFCRREWRSAAIHFGLCALVLAPVFYAARFSLYLLPFYLAGAAAMLLALPGWIARLAPRAPEALHTRLRAGIMALGGILVLVSGSVAVIQLRQNLASAPHETRAFGRLLAHEGLSGQRIMARKPHVAYFAGMNQVAMGVPSSMLDLIAQARTAKAEYLLYSPIERVLRPEFAVLSDSGVRLPGLEQVAYRSWGSQDAYAVYRVTGEPVTTAAMADAMDRALKHYLDRRTNEPEAQVFAAIQLLNASRYREALERLLVVTTRGGGEDPVVLAMISTAYFGLGDYDRSYRACQAAMEIERPTAWHYGRLGEIRVRQKRLAEARDCLRRAVEMEPGNSRYLEGLGLVYTWLGEYGPAAAAFDRCVKLAPRDAKLRRYAMSAYQLAGNERRAGQILADGSRQGIPVQQMLDPATSGPQAGAK